MKHLFIINPAAAQIEGYVEDVVTKIKSILDSQDIEYDIHITRWSRDAVGFVRRYVSNTDELVRVHSYGGGGTFYEVVNGVISLPNAEVAAYPMGSSNDFLQYFKRKNMKYFTDVESQLTSETILIDTMTDGTNYATANFLCGIEAEAYIDGSNFGRKIHSTTDFWPLLFAALKIFKQRILGRRYSLYIDDEKVGGDYASIMVANTPCYQKTLNPAVDAHPTDGVLDVYTVKSVSRLKFLRAIPIYTSGNYRRIPDVVIHHPCKKVRIICDDIMHTSFDGEILFAKDIQFSVVPQAIKLVIPKAVDLNEIPEIYKG